MQSNPQKKPAQGVLTGIKVVLVSGAVAGSIGIWGMLSDKALQSEMGKVSADNDQTNQVDNFTALPTLINVVTLNTEQAFVLAPTPTEAPGLRNVSAIPTQDASLSQPEIKTVVIGIPSGGSGGGGTKSSKASKPASSTKSS